jgi:hypothetical protein
MAQKEFAEYFCKRGDLAEELYSAGFRTEAYLIATTAINALAAIRKHDDKRPANGAALQFAEFLDDFAGDARTKRLAVVFLAEDAIRSGPPRLHQVAYRLLEDRAAIRGSNVEFEFRESPHAHRDIAWSDLVAEVPEFGREARLQAIARHYSYGALLYRLYRCGPAHALSRPDRATVFSQNEPDAEISYFPEYLAGGRVRPISLKIGLLAVTGWLRAVATAYAEHCHTAGRRPADGFEPGAETLASLAHVWDNFK